MQRPIARLAAAPLRNRNAIVAATAGALLCALAWLAASVSPRMGITYDELGHIVSGYTSWKLTDYRVNAENGILATRVSGAPLLPLALTLPAPDSPHWQTCNARALGFEFFYELGNDFTTIVQRARLGTLGFVLGLAWLIWRWAKGLFGQLAGLIALALATFSPTLLAHAGLATSDLILAFCLLAALSAWWRLWHRITWPRLALAGLTAGLAFTAKMSGVLLVPMLGLMLLLRWSRRTPVVLAIGGSVRLLRKRSATLLALFAASGVAAAFSVGVIWAAYGFRFAGAASTDRDQAAFRTSWSEVLNQIPATETSAGASPTSNTSSIHPDFVRSTVAWARDHRLLPEAFLWGFAYTYQSSRERESFLDGAISPRGWPQFFPLAFLYKSTPVELALFASGAAILIFILFRPGTRRRGALRWRYRGAPLAILFVGYWVAALATPLNIGHRHLLPVYPVVFVAAGAVAAGVVARRAIGPFVVVAALGWQVADSFAARPFYLSYFNRSSGGLREGWHHLVDSSFDWGQGLPDLAAWLEKKTVAGDSTPVFLTYFGSDSPRARHLAVTRFADARDDHGARRYASLTSGWYAISATYFHRVYLDLSGPWSDTYEREYAELGRQLRIDPAQAPKLTAEQRAHLRSVAMRYEVLQFGRLCHVLQHRTPNEIIGASLLLFRVTDADIQLALDAPLAELNAHVR